MPESREERAPSGLDQVNPATDPTRLVAEVLGIVAGTSITELDLRYQGLRIHVQREVHSAPEIAKASPAGDSPIEKNETRDGTTIVRSDYVGAFRHVAEDHLPVVGDEVAAGMRIAEIEVLGIRNPVLAPIDGVLSAVLVEEEAAVEYGQPIAVIQSR